MSQLSRATRREHPRLLRHSRRSALARVHTGPWHTQVHTLYTCTQTERQWTEHSQCCTRTRLYTCAHVHPRPQLLKHAHRVALHNRLGMPVLGVLRYACLLCTLITTNLHTCACAPFCETLSMHTCTLQTGLMPALENNGPLSTLGGGNSGVRLANALHLAGVFGGVLVRMRNSSIHCHSNRSKIWFAISAMQLDLLIHATTARAGS